MKSTVPTKIVFVASKQVYAQESLSALAPVPGIKQLDLNDDKEIGFKHENIMNNH